MNYCIFITLYIFLLPFGATIICESINQTSEAQNRPKICVAIRQSVRNRQARSRGRETYELTKLESPCFTCQIWIFAIKLEICIKYGAYGQICNWRGQIHARTLSQSHRGAFKYLIMHNKGMGLFRKLKVLPPPHVLGCGWEWLYIRLASIEDHPVQIWKVSDDF